MEAAYRWAEYNAQLRDLERQNGSNPQALLRELKTRQNSLRQRLEDFDLNFILQHGRQPTTAEGESEIRHLKESMAVVDRIIVRVCLKYHLGFGSLAS